MIRIPLPGAPKLFASITMAHEALDSAFVLAVLVLDNAAASVIVWLAETQHQL